MRKLILTTLGLAILLGGCDSVENDPASLTASSEPVSLQTTEGPLTQHEAGDLAGLDMLSNCAGGQSESKASSGEERAIPNIVARFYSQNDCVSEITSAAIDVDEIEGTALISRTFSSTQPRSWKFFDAPYVVGGRTWDPTLIEWIYTVGGTPYSSTSPYVTGLASPASGVHTTLTLLDVTPLPPFNVTLVEPINGVNLSSQTVTFKWTTEYNSGAYASRLFRIQVARDDAFTDIIHSNNTVDPSDNTVHRGGTQEYQANLSGLETGSTYYWRVKARNQFGEQDSWSVAGTFQYLGPPPPPPTVTASIVNSNPRLTWSAVQGAVSYEVEQLVLPEDINNSITMSGTVYTSSWCVTSIGYSLNMVRYRVRSFDVHGRAGGWSSYIYYRKCAT